MKFISLIIITCFLVSCQDKDSGTSCGPDETCLFDVTNYGYEDDEGEVPNEALTFNTNLLLVNFGNSDQDKVTQAAELIKKIVASQEFKDAVIHHTYLGQKTFVDNGGLTNGQIYYRLLQGAEKLSSDPNNTMDVELELYFEASSTIGYTNPGTKRIWLNTKYFNTFTPAQVAGNLTHEWLHKLGFGHAASSNPSRPYSVPYAIGSIMSKMSARFL